MEGAPDPEYRRQRGAFTALFVVAVVAVVGLGLSYWPHISGRPGHSGLGLGLVVLAPAAATLLMSIAVFDPPPGRGWRAALLGAVPLAVALAALTAAFAALAGQAVRWADPADYTGAYGSRVTVQLPERCENPLIYGDDMNPPIPGPDIVCAHSRWTALGAEHEGTVVLGWGDLPRPDVAAVPGSAEAYVIGDTGYSVERVGRVENVGRWGGAPLWWLAGLPAALVAWGLLAFTGWIKLEPDA